MPNRERIRIDTGWPAPALWPNSRVHWSRKHRASKLAKRDAYWSAYGAAPRDFGKLGERFSVAIEALPPVNRVRDADNLIAAAKPYLDGIADAIKVNDSQFNAPTVEWREPQSKFFARLFFTIEPLQ